MRISIIVAILFSFAFKASAENYCSLYKETLSIYSANAIFPVVPEKFNIDEFQNEFLGITDPYSIIFNGAEKNLFEKIYQEVTTDVQSAYCSISELLSNRYKQNVSETIKTLEQLKQLQLDFNKSGTYYIGNNLPPERLSMDKDLRCRNYIKLLLLQDLFDYASDYDSLLKSTNDISGYIDSLKTNRINKEIEKLKETIPTDEKTEELLYYAFFNALTNQYDPYCVAFSNEAFNDFKEELSGFAERFGFVLETNKQGQVVIASVQPGSYAWRTGMVNAGDKVLKLIVDSLKTIDVSHSSTNDLYEFLGDFEGDKITIILQKGDNTKNTVELFREQTRNTENSVQAFILNSQSKIGYIILPAFYSSWHQSGSFGCAFDVGRAIYKLKKQNIESLIIDLRNNGGGSILEAIDLAGIFIDFGTLSIQQDTSNYLIPIKDFNRGTMYNGPLAILVNSYSASASEMVSAVLQDYNRAIIIGESTFGKAVGQSLIPLNYELSSLLKVTTSKYYRVTGQSYNQTGVNPDIELPSFNKYSFIINKRANFIADTISKKVYYSPLKPIPKESLIELSQDRVSKSEIFQQIITSDSLYERLSVSSGYLPLSIDEYYSLLKNKEAIDSNFTTLNKTKSEAFTVDLLPHDVELQNMYKYYSDFYKQISESIIADPYVEESINILEDYKRLKDE